MADICRRAMNHYLQVFQPREINYMELDETLQTILFLTVLMIRIGFSNDLDPNRAFYLNTDPDPGLGPGT